MIHDNNLDFFAENDNFFIFSMNNMKNYVTNNTKKDNFFHQTKKLLLNLSYNFLKTCFLSLTDRSFDKNTDYVVSIDILKERFEIFELLFRLGYNKITYDYITEIIKNTYHIIPKSYRDIIDLSNLHSTCDDRVQHFKTLKMFIISKKYYLDILKNHGIYLFDSDFNIVYADFSSFFININKIVAHLDSSIQCFIKSEMISMFENIEKLPLFLLKLIKSFNIEYTKDFKEIINECDIMFLFLTCLFDLAEHKFITYDDYLRECSLLSIKSFLSIQGDFLQPKIENKSDLSSMDLPIIVNGYPFDAFHMAEDILEGYVWKRCLYNIYIGKGFDIIFHQVTDKKFIDILYQFRSYVDKSPILSSIIECINEYNVHTFIDLFLRYNNIDEITYNLMDYCFDIRSYKRCNNLEALKSVSSIFEELTTIEKIDIIANHNQRDIRNSFSENNWKSIFSILLSSNGMIILYLCLCFHSLNRYPQYEYFTSKIKGCIAVIGTSLFISKFSELCNIIPRFDIIHRVKSLYNNNLYKTDTFTVFMENPNMLNIIKLRETFTNIPDILNEVMSIFIFEKFMKLTRSIIDDTCVPYLPDVMVGSLTTEYNFEVIKRDIKEELILSDVFLNLDVEDISETFGMLSDTLNDIANKIILN